MTHLCPNNHPNTPELLAPAGDMASLLAALAGGADAVYLGAGEFNARRNAANFSLDGLREACDLAHLAGRRVYLALNTAVLPGEVEAACELARQAWYRGVDAAIVADIGLLARLASELPELELHSSTQANALNSHAVGWLSSHGAAMVTLGRELSVGEIARIAAGAVPVEVFVHGALCMSYSGQCLFSSLVGRRSANRGLCAQPCRLPYKLIDTSTGRSVATPGDRLLSPKDLCGIEVLEELAGAGVAALKIEGRMKGAEYVAVTSRVYREALDALGAGRLLDGPDEGACGSGGALSEAALPEHSGSGGGPVETALPAHSGSDADGAAEAAKSLEAVYSRGFSTAFLTGERGEAMMGYRRSAGRSSPEGADGGASAQTYNTDALFQGNNGLVEITMRVDAQLGKPLTVTATDLRSGLAGTTEGKMLEAARTKALTSGDIIEHVGRVGGTPYSITAWDIRLGEGVGVGFSALHSARRAALEALEAELLFAWHSRRLSRLERSVTTLPAAKRTAPAVFALVRDGAGAKAAKKAGASAIYYHTITFNADDALLGTDGAQASPWLPNVMHDADFTELGGHIKAGRPVVANELGSLALAQERGAAFEAGPALGTCNQAALALLAECGARRVWLGPELSSRDLDALAPGSPVPLGITVCGAQELMTTEHCLLSAAGQCFENCATCPRRRSPHLLEDRLGYRFPIRTDNRGRSHLFNAVPLDLVAEMPRLLALGIDSFLVDCTLLNTKQIAEDVARAVRACRLAAKGTGSLPKRESATTGHFHRGVL